MLPSRPESFVAWLNTTGKLCSGEGLFWSYGGGSDHNTAIRAAQAARANRSPAVNQKRKAMAERMEAARAARAARR